MRDIKIYRRVNVKDPVMLAGWPGMGNVALMAIDYLRKKMGGVHFAEIDTGKFSTPDAVIIKDGLAKLPPLPRNLFYYTKHPDLVIFEGEAQLTGKASIILMNEILDLARELKVRRIYTAAAFPLPMSYQEAPRVYGVANQKSLRDLLSHYRVRIMEGGQISGLNGLLLGFAERRGIEAACLLATLPNYAINFPNPKASRAIAEVLGRISNVRVDMRELDLAVKEMDERMAMIEERIKEIFPLMEKEEEIVNLEKEKVPDYVMKKIDKLFQEAKVDRKKAYPLKEELDRWDLYKFYEDRFLDLFKEHQ
ncbi:PAC2 family protein [bacterium]|nr:PAC2 family protein [bacterium]